MRVIVLEDNTAAIDNKMAETYSLLKIFSGIEAVCAEGRSTRVLKTPHVDVEFLTWSEAARDKSIYKRADLIFGIPKALRDGYANQLDSSKIWTGGNDLPRMILEFESMLKNDEERKMKEVVTSILKRRKWL